MKYIILTILIISGVLFGIYPGLLKKIPKSLKIILILGIILNLSLVFLPPTAGRLLDFKFSDPRATQITLNVSFKATSAVIEENHNIKTCKIDAIDPESENTHYFLGISDTNRAIRLAGKSVFANVTYNKADSTYKINEIYEENPLITYSYIPILEENVRIINLHVPMAWIAVLGYAMALIYSIKYLKTKKVVDDIIASSSAILGTVFCILATMTGMLWAKSNWGSYWNWDPRETSIFILLIIYFAYFALRMAIDKEELRARLSSVYCIITFVAVPFLIFILPRMATGLHPGSGSGAGGSSPILGASNDTLGIMKLTIFGFSFFCFTLLYFWLLKLNIKVRILAKRSML
jgi:heme exporter protein C